MTNKSKVELLLSKLREQLIALSMRDDNLSDNESHLLHTVETALPEIRNKLKGIYFDGNIDEEEARSFHQLMKETLEKAFSTARLDQVIDRDENDLLDHLHNTFVQITRLVKQDMRK